MIPTQQNSQGCDFRGAPTTKVHIIRPTPGGAVVGLEMMSSTTFAERVNKHGYKIITEAQVILGERVAMLELMNRCKVQTRQFIEDDVVASGLYRSTECRKLRVLEEIEAVVHILHQDDPVYVKLQGARRPGWLANAPPTHVSRGCRA